MGRYITLQPAYGRDYKSAKSASADYDANKDFVGDYECGFRYVNKEQIDALWPGAKIMFRYKRDTAIGAYKATPARQEIKP